MASLIACTGEFLYFLDDDNALKPHALSTLLRAAVASGAHILTTPNEKWPSLEPPPTADAYDTELWLPLGGSAALGIVRNCFGDAAALVSRAAFEELGGFTEDVGVGHEDWELWALAVLRGYVLQVVPEALYWYRIGPGRGGAMLGDSLGSTARARAQRQANLARSLRPYRAALGSWPEGRAVLQLAQSLEREPPPS